ncbi:MAG TPA: FecR domain-containing protein [Burkholderiales bacterium]
MLRLLAAVLAAGWLQSAIAQIPASYSGPEQPGTVAGRVELIEGDVRVLDGNRNVRHPKLGDEIHAGESIVTGADGEVHLDMEDGGYMGVRPNTNLRFAEFRADGSDADKSVLDLFEGSFRAVTGWIAKLGAKSYAVRTPTVTIGVRGTEHEPMVIPEGSRLGEAGTYERVHIGETFMQTPQGMVTVRPNQAGFAPHRGALRPRLLDRVPAFFRPTRNEARFGGLHARLQARMQQRREQRRLFLQERRKSGGLIRGPQSAPLRERQEARREQLQKMRAQKQQVQERREAAAKSRAARKHDEAGEHPRRRREGP